MTRWLWDRVVATVTVLWVLLAGDVDEFEARLDRQNAALDRLRREQDHVYRQLSTCRDAGRLAVLMHRWRQIKDEVREL